MKRMTKVAGATFALTALMAGYTAVATAAPK